MIIETAIKKLKCFQDEISYRIKDNDNPYIIRDMQDDIEAISTAITCMRMIEGGRKIV